MKILTLYDGDYPWDVRVEKMVHTFLTGGHSVRLLCRNRAGQPRYERLADGLEISRLPAVPDALSFPFFANPIWVGRVVADIKRFRPDRLVVRDLPLAPLAMVVGRLGQVPVIADLAEPYPDSLRSQWRFQQMSTIDYLVRNPFLADWVERLVVRGVDRVLVVCPEAGRRLESQGLSPGGWVEVGNTPMLDRFSPRGGKVPELVGLENRFLLLFSGLLAGDRGLEVALDALTHLRTRHPGRFALVVVGEGPVRARLEADVADRQLGGDVRFTGWIPYDRLPDFVVHAHLGVLPFHACEHINSTLANKLFEYMALRLPVVVSDVPPMVRVIRETGAGLHFRSGDSIDLASKIEVLADDAGARERYAAAGRRAVERSYNWNVDGRRLLWAIESAGQATNTTGPEPHSPPADRVESHEHHQSRFAGETRGR